MMRKLFLFLFLIAFIIQAKAQSDPYADSLELLIQTDLEDTNKVEHLNRLGWAIQYEDPNRSISLSNEALEICMQLLESEAIKKDEKVVLRVKRKLGQTFNCLGVFYWMASDYSTSIQYHQKALVVRKATGDRFNEGSSLNNLGLVYKAKGDYNEALKNYFAALSIALEFENKGLISTDLCNIGTVYHDMNDPKRALDFYFMAIPLYKSENDMIGLSMAYGYVGNAYVDLHQSKRALQYYDMGVKISKNIENIYLEAFLVNNTGEVYSKMGDNLRALESYHLSLPMAREIGELSLVSTVLSNIGVANMKLGRFKEAERYLTEAMEISNKIEAYPNIELTAYNLSELYAKTKRFELAYKTQKLYITAHDSIYNETKTKELGQLETKHELTLEAREKQRAEEERLRTLKAEKNRKDLLQISGIVLLLVIFGLVVMVLGFKKVSPKIANGITFFATLILFEFLLVLFDPMVDKMSNGEPAYKLLCNAILALGIFPVHGLLVKLLKSKLSKKKQGQGLNNP